MPLVGLFHLCLYHIKQELSRMKRVLCSISEMNPLSKRCHCTVRPGFPGEGLRPTQSQWFLAETPWLTMTLRSQERGSCKREHRVLIACTWGVRRNQNFLPENTDLFSSGRNSNRSYLRAAFSASTHRALHFIYFLMFVFFSTCRAYVAWHWAVSCHYLYPLRLPSAWNTW